MNLDEVKAETVRLLGEKRFIAMMSVAISLLVLVYTELSGNWGDLDHYYVNAGDVLSGKIPYSDMVFEYPPLSLLFMIIPRVLSWDLSSFHYLCAIQTYVFIAIGAHFLYKIADEFIGSRWKAGFVILCLLIFGSYFVIARNDIYPAVMVLIGLWFYLRKDYTLAFILVAVAAMTKMYPAIFIIPMLMPILYRRQWNVALKAILAVVAVGLLVELPFIIADPSTAFAYLSYHSDRGIQVESVASGFFMLYSLVVPSDITVLFGYGSDNLCGAGPDALAPWMNILTIVAIALFLIVMALKAFKASVSDERMLRLSALTCLAVLMVFITFSKVYSAQYYIWIVMMLPMAYLVHSDRESERRLLAISLLFGIFTMVSYLSYNSLGLVQLNAAAVMAVVMKNLFHIMLMIEIFRLCWFETEASDNQSCIGDSEA